MRYKVARFKSLEVCLKELEPFIRHGQHLETGKPFKQIGGLRSREMLANWLLCIVLNWEAHSPRLSFTSDPQGGDGIIYDGETASAWPTEHVLVPRTRAGAPQDLEQQILNAIARKRSKGGAAYASGKQLVVFLNVGGERPWVPNRIARQLPQPLHFSDIWVVGLQGVEAGEYVYNVTRLNLVEGNAPIWRVLTGRSYLATVTGV
jgi:hypothetical protein